MTDVSEMTVDQIKAKLLEAGAALHTHRTIAEQAEAAREAAEKAWKEQPDVKALFETAEKAATVKRQSEANVKAMQEALYLRTGEKNPDPAFQIRISQKPIYEQDKMMDWFLNIIRDFMVINPSALNAWLKDNADDKGTIPVYAFEDPIPAIIMDTPTPAIISAGLEKLAAKPIDVVVTDPPLTKTIQPVGPAITITPIGSTSSISQATVSVGAPSGYSLTFEHTASITASTSEEVARAIDIATLEAESFLEREREAVMAFEREREEGMKAAADYLSEIPF